MKTANNPVKYLAALAIAGVLIHLPCRAQSQTDRLKSQNLGYWSGKEQAQRYQLSQRKVDIDYLFRSRVVSDSSFNSIRDCHIINTTQRMATVSDAYGNFKIVANLNDSISFSALGYEKRTIVVTDSVYNYGHIIQLKPITYEMDEVVIRPLIEAPVISKWEVYAKPLPNQGGVNIPTDIHPVSFFYDRFSKEGKQKKYYRKITNGTADFMVIGEKFNGEMVAELTGLQNDELIKFMSYCNFSNYFLMNYSPKTIQRAIRQKYQEYIAQ